MEPVIQIGLLHSGLVKIITASPETILSIGDFLELYSMFLEKVEEFQKETLDSFDDPVTLPPLGVEDAAKAVEAAEELLKRAR